MWNNRASRHPLLGMLHLEDVARPFGRHPLVLWGIAFAAVTVFLLLVSGQGFIYDTMHDRSARSLVQRLRWPAVFWYSWALLAPFIFILARRFPFIGDRWRMSLLVHLGGCAVFYVIHVSLQVASMYTPPFDHIHPDFMDALRHHTAASIDTSILVYGLVVGIAHGYTYYQRYRQRELRAGQLESELARARLQALKTQLHPHFLFNTLHSISTLMYRDVPAADRMLSRLSDLLRLSLESSDAQEVPLHDEVAFATMYLEIEQIRLGDRLTVDFDIDPALDDVLVPNLILQPIVENAVKHGIAPRSAPGHIDMRAWADAEQLHLRVSDNGLGLPEPPARLITGIGLSNVQARLVRLYGDDHHLTLRPANPSGLIVEMTLPLRRVEEETEVVLT